MAFKLKGTGLYKYTAGKNGGSFKHTAKFGERTSINEMDAVEKHNKRHQKGDTHAEGTYSGRKDFHGNAGEWNAKKEGGDKPVAKKYKKAKPVAKKHEPGHGGNSTVEQLKKELKKAMEEGNDRKITEIRKKLMAAYKAEKGGPKKYKK